MVAQRIESTWCSPKRFLAQFFFLKIWIAKTDVILHLSHVLCSYNCCYECSQEMLKGVGILLKIVESVKATEREATSADAPLLPVAKEDFSDVQLGRGSDFVLPVASSLKVRSSDDHATPKKSRRQISFWLLIWRIWSQGLILWCFSIKGPEDCIACPWDSHKRIPPLMAISSAIWRWTQPYWNPQKHTKHQWQKCQRVTNWWIF